MSKQTIAEQIEFVEWLKSKHMYNRFASEGMMQSMFDVWKEMKKELKK